MGVDHYENFPVASILLPKRLRFPVQAIYHFARMADDIADEGDIPPDQRLAQLDVFRTRLHEIAAGGMPDDPLFGPLTGVIRKHDLPIPLLHDLLDAFSQDVTRTRYEDFNVLLDYCRRSANPVGRLMLHLFNRTDDPLPRQSDDICTSLQLINFLQDVDADYRRGRIYLPLDELRHFGVSEHQIAVRDQSESWRALMAFQVRRARELMLRGAPLARALPGRIGLELRLIVAGGLRILDKLQAVQGDVFQRRPVLNPADWMLMLWQAAVRGRP